MDSNLHDFSAVFTALKVRTHVDAGASVRCRVDIACAVSLMCCSALVDFSTLCCSIV